LSIRRTNANAAPKPDKTPEKIIKPNHPKELSLIAPEITGPMNTATLLVENTAPTRDGSVDRLVKSAPMIGIREMNPPDEIYDPLH
jgi:hypothetical protein